MDIARIDNDRDSSPDRDSDSSLTTHVSSRRDDPERREGDRVQARRGRGRFEAQQARRREEPPSPFTPLEKSFTFPFTEVSVGRLPGGGVGVHRKKDGLTTQVNFGGGRGVQIEGDGFNEDGDRRIVTASLRPGHGINSNIDDYSPRSGHHRRNKTLSLGPGENGPSGTTRETKHRRNGDRKTKSTAVSYDMDDKRMSIDHGRSKTWQQGDGPHTQSWGVGADISSDGVEVSASFSHVAPTSRFAVRGSGSSNLRTTIAHASGESEGMGGMDYLNGHFDGALQLNDEGYEADGMASLGFGGNGPIANTNRRTALTGQGSMTSRRGTIQGSAGGLLTDRTNFQQLPFGVPGTAFLEPSAAVQGRYENDRWVLDNPQMSYEFGYDPGHPALGPLPPGHGG